MQSLILALLIVASLVAFALPVWTRLKLVLASRYPLPSDQIGRRIKRFISEVIFQSKVIKERPFAGIMHTLVFWGFLAFGLETIHHFATGFGWHPLGEGTFHRIYGGFVAVFAVLVIIGITALAVRRFIFRPPALGKLSWTSALVALFIEILMVTYLLDYFEVLKSPTAQLVNWWIHALTILAFLALIPHSKHLHLVLSPFTTFFKDFELARIRPLDFEKEEMGVEKLADFSAHTVLGAFTCVECGRCYDHCPARQTGKLLDPKQLMLDLRAGLLADAQQFAVGNVITEEILWQCTTCGACTYQCPVGIDQVVPILEMRRGRVSAGEFPDTMRALFDNLERAGNPWKYNPSQAQAFLDENGFPDFDNHDVLFWLGCMGRYDFYYQKVALATAKLLNAAGVSWGILRDEQCTGDAARRAGNEFIFQALAEQNITLLNEASPRLILATCPHCLRTLGEYKDLGLNREVRVVHHSEFLSDLLKSGRLKLNGMDPHEVVFHDPCYLSRYLGDRQLSHPREVLRGSGNHIVEAANHGEHSFCCGAGGALLFTEEKVGERVNHRRAKELLETKANTVGTACPFCHLMLRDGMKDLGHQDVKVRDIAEELADRLPANPQNGATAV